MIERKPNSNPTAPDYTIIFAKWVGTGMACRVWYIQGGQVKMVFAEGMAPWQVESAIRRQR